MQELHFCCAGEREAPPRVSLSQEDFILAVLFRCRAATSADSFVRQKWTI
jgi:hypothetical protein